MKDRNSGFTTAKTIGVRRGDNTELVQLELVVKPVRVGTLRSEKAALSEKTDVKATTTKKSVAKKTETPEAVKAGINPVKKTTATKAAASMKNITRKSTKNK
jgi:hypothetical protein